MLGREAVCLLPALAFLVACGGSSVFSGTEGTTAGAGGSSTAGGTAGAGIGGSSSTTGGSGGTAGTETGGGSGGSSGQGGSSGSSGSSGSGGSVSMGGSAGVGFAGTSGTPGIDCSAPPALTREECVGQFYVNPETLECTAAGLFVCANGPNRFTSLGECLAACPGTKPTLSACSSREDCIVGSTGCCGLCPDAPFDTALGLNAARALAGDYQPCGDVACEPCADVPEPARVTQYYAPTCEASACGVVDLRTTEDTACTQDQDCFLRLGTDCCERCDGSGWAALSSTEFLSGCRDLPCPACAPAPPPDLAARCIAGRCAVQSDGTSLPACSATPTPLAVQGCILDDEGAVATSLAPTRVTVVSVGAGDATGCPIDTTLTTEVRLLAEDSREWRYFVYLPDRPLDQVQTGDELELSVDDRSPLFFDQRVVLSRTSDLVLFTVVSTAADGPDLGEYGISLALGDAYCQGPGASCSMASHFPLLVTRGSESAELKAGETALVGDLSVSVDSMLQAQNCTFDPSMQYRYGGFVAR